MLFRSLQQPDLKPSPGLLTDWGWNDDKTQVHMTVRDGVSWHDGSPFTAEVKQFDPTIFKWMYFLTGYVLPKAYYTKVGAVGF